MRGFASRPGTKFLVPDLCSGSWSQVACSASNVRCHVVSISFVSIGSMSCGVVSEFCVSGVCAMTWRPWLERWRRNRIGMMQNGDVSGKVLWQPREPEGWSQNESEVLNIIRKAMYSHQHVIVEISRVIWTKHLTNSPCCLSVSFVCQKKHALLLSVFICWLVILNLHLKMSRACAKHVGETILCRLSHDPHLSYFHCADQTERLQRQFAVWTFTLWLDNVSKFGAEWVKSECSQWEAGQANSSRGWRFANQSGCPL